MPAWGYVYFVQVGKRGPIKIGSAINVGRRVSSLQTGHYEDLHLVATLPDVVGTLEMRLHDRFAHARIRGEWFRANDPELTEFLRDVINDEPPEWIYFDASKSRFPVVRICSACPWQIEQRLIRRDSDFCERCLDEIAAEIWCAAQTAELLEQYGSLEAYDALRRLSWCA